MSPKKAILILIALIIVGGVFFYLVYLGKQSEEFINTARFNTAVDENKNNIESAKTPQAIQDLSKEEQEKIINQKIEEKTRAIEATPEEIIRTQGYTQEELDFIANPRKETEKELGITTEE